MINLEETFVSGSGGFSSDPLTYKQLKRNEKVALYERSHSGKVTDYEVFLIRIDSKGKTIQFPNGVVKVFDDDTEQYPATGVFGQTAWSCINLERATTQYERLIKMENISNNDSVKPDIIIPDGEFSVKDLAEKNSISYALAAVIIKGAVATKGIKFTREERRSVQGKLTKLYMKT